MQSVKVKPFSSRASIVAISLFIKLIFQLILLIFLKFAESPAEFFAENKNFAGFDNCIELIGLTEHERVDATLYDDFEIEKTHEKPLAKETLAQELQAKNASLGKQVKDTPASKGIKGLGEDSFYRVTCKDNGKGMPHDDIPNMFGRAPSSPSIRSNPQRRPHLQFAATQQHPPSSPSRTKQNPSHLHEQRTKTQRRPHLRFAPKTHQPSAVLTFARTSAVLSLTNPNSKSIQIWDLKTTDCIQTFKPPPPLRGGDASVNSVYIFPKNTEHIVVCNKTSSIYIMTLQGQVVKSFSSGKREGGDFVAACVSPKGEWIYCVGEDRNMYCFSYQSGKLEHLMKVFDDPTSLTEEEMYELRNNWATCFLDLYNPEVDYVVSDDEV
ncbi:unnamed protein product [Trifolium pratense]|uniref:Uncharacterized protein n=1 Tax=Trifolium pratense TaxID=57577 RepID=A0ACB0K1Q8_TRIPR|nr:unnamed protein product [Trifolium pratense]